MSGSDSTGATDEAGASTILSGLPDSLSALLSGFSELAQFAAGQLLFRRGNLADGFFLVHSGVVAIELPARSGRIVVDTVRAGGVVGWSWLFPPHRWHFDARAVKRTRAIKVDGAAMRQRCEQDHDVGYEMYRRFSQVMLDRLQASYRQLVDARVVTEEAAPGGHL